MTANSTNSNQARFHSYETGDEFRCVNAEININVNTSKVTITGDLRSHIKRPPLPPARNDMENLAYAVLEGDYDAALALADEVQMRHSRGDGFVSTQVLLEALEPFATFADTVDLLEGNKPDGLTVTHIAFVTNATLTLGDCRDASEALSKYRRMLKND